MTREELLTEAMAKLNEAIGRGAGVPAYCAMAECQEQKAEQASNEVARPLLLKGIEFCDLALKLDPESPAAHTARALLLHRLSQRSGGADSRQHIQQGLEQADLALKQRPDWHAAHNARGLLILRQLELGDEAASY